MVYSSTPLYLDPHNWNHHQQQAQIHQHHQEHQNHQLGPNHGGQHHEIALQMPPPPAGSQAVGGGNSSSIRPGSMADRARQAKIPQPEPGLKCPRCESTNTKFCYFNNYSLTQPRHFCKMCRRYWTRGGALRNVPVGGGCRRNKRSSSSSKNGGGSKALGDQRQAGAGPSHNSTSPLSSNSNNTDINNNNNNNNPNLLEASLPDGQNFQPRLTQFPLLASLQGGLNHHGGQYGYPSSNLGLSFNNGMMGSAGQAELGFQIGAASSVNNNTDQQWRPHHYFPNFLASLDPHQGPHRTPSSSSLYQFPIDHHSMDQQVANPTLNRSLSIARSAAMNQQPVRPSNTSTDQQSNEAAAAAVKPEEPASQGSGMNSLSRSLLGMADNSQYWATDDNNSATTWTDLSGLNSSTTRLL